MPYRSPARFLAPLALMAAAIAVLVVISSSGGGGGTSPSPASTPVTAATRTTPHRPRRRTYVVKPGDTLSAIAVKTGVPLDRIQTLNPSLDAQTLNAGDTVKLAP